MTAPQIRKRPTTKAPMLRLRFWLTRIGGIRFTFRLWRLLLDWRGVWDVPWAKYETPVYFRVKHMNHSHGIILRLRILKPTVRLDCQWLTSRQWKSLPEES